MEREINKREYEIRAIMKNDRYGMEHIVLERTYDEYRHISLMNMMEEVNNNKFVYDYNNNNEVVLTTEIKDIILVPTEDR